jgi:type VI secretion system secreted protein VgrG
MASSNYTQTNRPYRVYTQLGTDVLLLENLEGEEAVSRPFEYRLDMLSLNDSISASDLIRQPIYVEIDLADGSQRVIHGLVSHFLQRGRRQVLTAYTATIRPWFWFLSLWQDCKIFQSMTVPDIIEKIFKNHSYTDFSVNTYKTYTALDYCVQYRESCFDFVSRLMEEEGIFYYFQHTSDKHTMVLTDATTAYEYVPGQKTASMSPMADSYLDDDVLTDVECEVRAVSGQVTLTDYNFTTPSTSLLVTTSGAYPEEVYDYPGKYDDHGGGETYTDLRLQEREMPETIIRGAGNTRPFIAGYKFDLKDHYRRDLNLTYVLTRLRISMSTNAYTTSAGPRDDYSNEFEAIPATVTFRPPRLTPRPIIPGVQTAVVVGPSGEEIYSDKYGRIKVQFFWDRDGKDDENSSCWIRVAQEWAGTNWGAVFIPRIGQEVMVEFLEGDPDRPIITGRVYNAQQMPPYTLPDNQTQTAVKTRSSKGGGSSNYNELFFEDKMGSELIRVHAEKDLLTEVEHDETRTVGNDRTTTISNNETKTVDKGNETITLNQGNQSTTIKMGNQSTELNQGNQSTTLDMGNQSIELKMGNQSTKADLGQISMEAMQSITLTVGESSIKIDQMGVTIQGMMISIQGQIQVQVQGLMIQISADAMLQEQGAITMINCG